MLIILTGPPAAGKTTVARLVAERLPKAAHLSIDTLRGLVKGGYVAVAGQEAEAQTRLAEALSRDMIRRYAASGYDVVLDHVLDADGFAAYRGLNEPAIGFLLLPRLATLHERDRLRPLAARMGARVDELYPHFRTADAAPFTAIDSSAQTPEETADIVRREALRIAGR